MHISQCGTRGGHPFRALVFCVVFVQQRARAAGTCYCAYARNNRFLIEMLPLSPEVNILLQHVFRCEATHHASLEQVRAAVEMLDSFFMCPALIARVGPVPLANTQPEL